MQCKHFFLTYESVSYPYHEDENQVYHWARSRKQATFGYLKCSTLRGKPNADGVHG